MSPPNSMKRKTTIRFSLLSVTAASIVAVFAVSLAVTVPQVHALSLVAQTAPPPINCGPDAVAGPPSASIPPEQQPYFQCQRRQSLTTGDCNDGDRGAAKKLAAANDFVGHKATYGDLDVTLRYAEYHQCYWGLVNDVGGTQLGSVWLERRAAGGNDEPEQLGYRAVHVFSSSSYTGTFRKRHGKEVRACARTDTIKFDKGLDKNPNDSVDQGGPLCTDWY